MSLVLGLGFGVGTVVTLAYFTRDSELPMSRWFASIKRAQQRRQTPR
jgi:hypothetical protein